MTTDAKRIRVQKAVSGYRDAVRARTRFLEGWTSSARAVTDAESQEAEGAMSGTPYKDGR